MSLTALEYKTQGNQYYSNQQSSLAIQSYTEAIKLIEKNSEDEINLPLHLLYLNRSAAFIQDKDFYSGYQDAKKSLKLKKHENFKGFYRAAICAYHLGFIEKSKEFIREATNDHQQNILDYLNLKLLLEKKDKCMKRWRKPIATAKKGIKLLEQIIEKGTLFFEIPSILYQIRYTLRSYFENTKDKKLMNMDHGDLGLRLHELAVEFNHVYPIEKLIQTDPIFEDLILNEMPDVGLLRIKAYKQRHLARDKKDYDLEDKSGEDLTAYEFSFFVNNVLASLVVNSSDENISLRALKQIHRLTAINLYRRALGDALSDAVNNYIYRNYQTIHVVEQFLANSGIEILFYDYLESSCSISASRMIKQITIGHWKKQSLTTIQFILKQISKKIRLEGIELIEARPLSTFELEFKKIMSTVDSSNGNYDQKKDFDLIINVLTKIYFIFGQQPFIDRSLYDPLFLYINQIWFKQINNDQNKPDIPYLLTSWTSILTQWLKLTYRNRQQYIEKINPELLYNDDSDDDETRFFYI
ncbi:unnamed protein product [Adineta steineri]|uniref:Uncharacterized protein n=1 Tax=Adineta steineri TaxID=433720 RepID=A0A814AE15_9BILA|nr:unnamed protein product [Adineta steineri]CAF0913499.1 unnamed protein product [Adineta steineri]